MTSTLRLARELLVAPDSAAAAQLVATYCVEQLGLPAAAWAVGSDPAHLELVDVGAMGADRAMGVRSQLGRFLRYRALSPADRAALRERFASLVGASSVEVLDADRALVMVAGNGAGVERHLRGLEDLLNDVLQQRAESGPAERRNASLDLGLAVTAHELRAPLLTSRVAIEGVASSPELSGSSRRILKGAATVLSELARSVDAILSWASGSAALRTRRIDLSKVVGQAARQTSGGDRSRLRLSTSGSVQVKADPRHLRVAFGNLMRNALEHAPASVPVEVNVGRSNGRAIVTVVDGGPGVSESERASIFDPFVSGSDAAGQRRGRGLGLFITRRVIEAHGGRVWVESSGRGARFHVSLPAAEALP